MQKLVLAITSDVHLFDWMPYSTIDEFGRPSRLTDYIQLANDFVNFSRSINADLNILAGDIIQSPTVRPRVLDTAREFLLKIAELSRVLVIPGQHDTDTKENSLSDPNCVLTSLCDGIDQIILCNKNTLHVEGPYRILLCPWNPLHKIPSSHDVPAVDIFVGHGTVIGSQDHRNYVFTSGFKQEELFNRFKVSIVGDVHNGQLIRRDDNIILVPGTPTSNSFKDSPTTGFWKVELEGREVRAEFFPIEKVGKKQYHSFITTDDENIKETPYVHVKYNRQGVLPTIGALRDSTSSISSKDSRYDITEIVSRIVDESKVNNGDEIKEVIKNYVEKAKTSVVKVPKNVSTRKIKISNFLSIKEYELDLTEFPRDLVIVGANGAGKSTLCEAVYWAITGKTTKSILVSDVANKKFPQVLTTVSLNLKVNNSDVIITRSRIDGNPKLSITIDGKEFIKSTTSETQEEIYRYLGFDADDINLLCYFPAQNSTLFGDLTTSNRNNTVAKIIGLSEIDVIAEMASSDYKILLNDGVKIDVEKKTIEHQIMENANQVQKLKTSMAASSSVTKRSNDIDEEIKNLGSVDINKITEIGRKISSLKDDVQSLQLGNSDDLRECNQIVETIDKWNRKILDLKNKLDTVTTSSKCYACSQVLVDTSLQEKLTKDLENANFEYQLCNEEGSKRRYALATKVEKSNKQIINKLKDVDSLNAVVKSLTDKKYKIDTLLREKNSLQVVDHSSTINILEDRINSMTQQVVDLTTKVAENNRKIEMYTWINKYLLKRNSILYSKMIESASSLVQYEIASITQSATFRIKVNKDFGIEGRFEGDQFIEYNALSNGQKRVVDVVMMVALNNVNASINNLSHGILGIAIFDEILSYLDENRIEELKAVLDESKAEKIIVVTHENKLMTLFDNKLLVSLNDYESTYTKSWGTSPGN